jgi:hypothetical protein
MIAVDEAVRGVHKGTKQPVPENRLLTTPQAAKLLGVSTAFLARDRWLGAQIPFVRISSRLVRYRIDDLHEYILRNTHGPEGRE